MKHIYLDQNKWIDLRRAQSEADQAKYKTERDFLKVAQAGVEAGLLSFPLSLVHYIETSNRGDRESRHALADMMAGLSRFDTIASPRPVLDMEIDQSLRSIFGRPNTVRAIPIFGHGVAHAAANPFFASLITPEMIPDPIKREAALHAIELEMLRGLDDPKRKELTDSIRDNDERYAEWEEARRELAQTEGYGKGEDLQRLMVGEGIGEIIGETVIARDRAGIGEDEFFSIGKEGLTQFLEGVSTRWVVTELRRRLRANPTRKWEGNDLRDLTAMSLGVVYCDVVVTERQYAAETRHLKLDRKYDTVVTHRLQEAISHLVAI